MHDGAGAESDAQLARIDRLISTTRRMLRSAWLLTGLALSLSLFLVMLGFGALLDLFGPLSIPLRLVALCTVLLSTLLALVAGVARPAIRHLSANHIARRIERLVPQIQSRLVTTLDLRREAVYRSASGAFHRQLIHETSERVRNFRPASVVDRGNLRRAVAFAVTALLMFAGLFGIFAQRLPTTLARIFLPFADIPPATGVRFSAEPGNAIRLKGDDVTISAIVEQGSPADMTLEFRARRGPWTRQVMHRSSEQRFDATLDTLEQPIEYRLVGGGTWTKRNTIEVIERPSIADMHTVVRYPDYMKMPEPKIGPPGSPDAIGPIGSQVEVVVDVAGQAASGEIQFLTPVAIARPVPNRNERVWFEGKLPDGARAEGNWQWDYALKFRAAHTEPPGSGGHSHGFHSATTGFELRSDEVIYTYVMVVPDQIPQEIMLQFHDGRDWEHRAFWGADMIQAGSPNTPSRTHMGEIPTAGEWVRLEVPARAVGMDGKKLYGIFFNLFGGQCKWHRGGALDAGSIVERSFAVQSRQPMKRVDDNSARHSPLTSTGGSVSAHGEAGTSSGAIPDPHQPDKSVSRWSGSFPLTQNGYYRLNFQNELGYTNKLQQEGRITAVPDNPPQVVLERPGTDLILSQPQKVPLFVRAYDDFGLSDIALAVQKGDSGGFVGAPIKMYDELVRSDSIIASLDLEPHQLKAGEVVRYRVQARDRKGQIAQTQEFTVRIQPDNSAADKQLAAIAQNQNLLQVHLDELIRQQSKITRSLEQMKSSDTLQELSKLVGPQDANVQLASQVQNELSQTADQTMNSKLTPPQIATQMRQAEQLFQSQALQPMRELLDSLRHSGGAQAPHPNTEAMADSAEQIQRQLEATRSQLKALAQAQQNMTDDPAGALAQLRRDLLAESAQWTAQQLKDLRDFLDRLAGQLKMLEGREDQLAQQTAQATPVVLPEIDKEQTRLESDAETALRQTDEIVQADSREAMKRPPRSANARDAALSNEQQSTGDVVTADYQAELAPAEMQGSKAPAKRNASGRDEPGILPHPPGVKAKDGTRAMKTARSTKQSAQGESKAAREPEARGQTWPHTAQEQPSSQSDTMRSQLTRRQELTSQELREAQEQLQDPRQRIDQLIQQLRDALGPEHNEASRQLARVIQSMDMHQAMQLAQAMRRAQQAAKQSAQHAQAASQPVTTAAMNSGLRVGAVGAFESNEIDLVAQAVLLRMQPRDREELLQGMREEGPEAYRQLIQEYFIRLTKIKSPP